MGRQMQQQFKLTPINDWRFGSKLGQVNLFGKPQLSSSHLREQACRFSGSWCFNKMDGQSEFRDYPNLSKICRKNRLLILSMFQTECLHFNNVTCRTNVTSDPKWDKSVLCRRRTWQVPSHKARQTHRETNGGNNNAWNAKFAFQVTNDR